jgi:transposase
VAGRGATSSQWPAVALRAGREAARVSSRARVWVVERKLARLSRSRQFSKDYERLPETAEAMIYGAMSRSILGRFSSGGVMDPLPHWCPRFAVC